MLDTKKESEESSSLGAQWGESMVSEDGHGLVLRSWGSHGQSNWDRDLGPLK